MIASNELSVGAPQHRGDDADNQNNDWRGVCAQTLTKFDLDHIVR
ncbi:hypothetical protein [Serratia plymuthica]|nr:hypothetical protein [Serratia plymuthica]